MTDIKLPAGYEDWVEKEWPDVIHPDQPPMGSTYLRVIHELVEMNSAGRYVGVQGGTVYFVPPKPKPTLPDVKPGAVVRFMHKAYGTPVQAVKWRTGSDWHIQFKGAGNALCETYCGDAWMLATVDEDGFTVELEGL